MFKNIALAMKAFKKQGGTESYMFDIVKGLQAYPQISSKIKVYASKFDRLHPLFSTITPVLVNQKIIPKQLRQLIFSKQLNRIRSFSDEVLIAAELVENADILICGGTHIGYLKNTQKKPTLRDKLTFHIGHKAYHSAKHIVAHSNLMRQELIDYYQVSENKISTVYPPIDQAMFFVDDSQISLTRKKYHLPEDEILFLFPSTGHQRKGFDILATYFEKSNLPIKLIVAGTPLPHPRRNIISLGFCNDMPSLYRAADFTIMASQYEPFGLVGIESILCGTKIVFAENIACKEVMQAEAGFFFNRQQPETLHQAILAAIADKKAGSHRLQSPLSALTYNPSMKNHIDTLLSILDD